jgi:hypothetical protein
VATATSAQSILLDLLYLLLSPLAGPHRPLTWPRVSVALELSALASESVSLFEDEREPVILNNQLQANPCGFLGFI